MDIFNNLELTHIRKICEKVVKNSSVKEDYSNQKMEALKEVMALNEKLKQESKPKKNLKNGLISVYKLSMDRKIHPYELLKKNEFIKNPVDEFLEVN